MSLAPVPSFQHATPAFRTFCGPEALKSLPRELARLGAERAMVFCEPAIAHHHPDALARVESALGDRFAGRYEGIDEHSPLPAVQEGRSALHRARADAVIAVGGGSAVVTARASTILLAEDKDIRELCTRRGDDGRLISPRLSAPKLPQWVVPSTPVTAYAKAGSAVRDPSTQERLALFDPATRAKGIFLDPDMAITAPVRLAQSSSLNAFSMAVEGIQSLVNDPLADALLVHALRTLVEWLPRLIDAPEDPAPRLQLMIAALLSGQGSDFVGGGLAQALSHAVGPRSSTANGVAEALLLPYVMRYNAPVTASTFTLIAGALDASLASGAREDAAVAVVERFLLAVGVPRYLSEVGISRDALSDVVAHTVDDWALSNVPRPASGDDLMLLLEEAWGPDSHQLPASS